MTRVRVAVFDLFGVLLTSGFQSARSSLVSILDRPEKSIAVAYKKWEPPFDRGEISPSDFWRRVNDDLGTSGEWKTLDNAVLSAYRPIPGSWDLLAELHDAGLRLSLASNTRRPWFEYLDSKWSISRHFDSVCLSWDEGVRKPDIALLQAASAPFDVLPSEVL